MGFDIWSAVLIISLIVILIIWYHNKSREPFTSCYKNTNKSMYNKVMDNQYPKIIQKTCEKKKKAMLKVYTPSKKTVTFNNNTDVTTFNKNDSPNSLKKQQLNKCINDNDCIIEDPCTKANCHYHLIPNSLKCKQRHIHHIGYNDYCKNNFITPVLDPTKPINVGVKTDPKKINDKHIQSSNKVCKIVHNSNYYIPTCVHPSVQIKH